MSFWRQKPRWPPLPSVEDEFASLARELHGLSTLAEDPGFEGVCSRGTIDQYPVILDVFSFSSVVVSTVTQDIPRGDSPSDDSTGPSTPPLDYRQPSIPRFVNVLKPKSMPLRQPVPLPTPPTIRKTLPQGQSCKQPPPPPGRVKSMPATVQRSASQQPSSSLKKSTDHKEPPSAKPKVAFSSSQMHTPKGQREPASSSVPRRSESVKHGRPIRRSLGDTQRSISYSGYQSDSAAIKHKAGNDSSDSIRPSRSSQKAPKEAFTETPKETLKKNPKETPNVPSLAERLEEKLRQRQEQRDTNASVQSEKQALQNSPVPPSTTRSDPTDHKADAPATSRQALVSGHPKLVATGLDLSQEKEEDIFSASFAVAPSLVNPPQRPPLGGLLESRSLSSDGSPSNRIPTRRTVSFLDEALKPAPCTRKGQDIIQQLQSSRNSSPHGPVRPPSPSSSGSCLLPCPRSVPVAGYQDWFTIRGSSHLNICPSCMKQMRKSKFRDLFILGSPRPRGEKVRCSMSEPWTRLAWMQTLKKQLEHLDLLQQITRPRSENKSCTGRIISDQHWYRVIDPDTGMYLPKFNICSACVKNLRILMPPHRNTFKRSLSTQERVCDFVTDSPRFIHYIDYLDIAANRSEQEWFSQPDLTEFMAYARRKVVLRDCRRDRLTLNTWHYMAQLPELTACEDCYDDVVWPLVKANQPIARKFSTLMRLPAGKGSSRCREASCQLYSPRMRAKFRDAVQRNDLHYLKLVALRRFDAEQRFRERREELLDDQARGYECEADLRKNLEDWKMWE